jgi:hypothetical protein
VSRLQLVGVTFLAAIAIDVAIHLPTFDLVGTIGRSIALFGMGWAIGGIVYLASGRKLSRESLAWIVAGSSVVCAILALFA